MQAYLEARSALVRMIDPAAMGRFRVLAFGRGLPPDGSRSGLRLPTPSARARAATGRRTPPGPPTRANALLPRVGPSDHAPLVRHVPEHRRGAGRELARALGANRSPIPLSHARSAVPRADPACPAPGEPPLDGRMRVRGEGSDPLPAHQGGPTSRRLGLG